MEKTRVQRNTRERASDGSNQDVFKTGSDNHDNHGPSRDADGRRRRPRRCERPTAGTAPSVTSPFPSPPQSLGANRQGARASRRRPATERPHRQSTAPAIVRVDGSGTAVTGVIVPVRPIE